MMKRISIFTWLVLIIAVWSCKAPEQPKTDLTLITNGNPVDTLQIIDELRGLLALTTGPDASGRSFTVTAAGSGDTLKLAVRPELTDAHKEVFGALLDTLSSHPSAWSPAALTLFYSDNDREIAELLQLDTLNGYPLAIDHASARWTYEEMQTFMTGPLASGAAVSYLDYRLKQPLPSSSYTLGLDKTSGETNEAAELVSSILGAVGPISSAFKVTSDDTSITPLWDSLRMNHRLHIDSLQLAVRWAHVEFPYREFSRHTDQDTMITSSIDKLRSTPPYLFHALVAPRLSRIMTGYRWNP